jgi:hypothetical protein
MDDGPRVAAARAYPERHRMNAERYQQVKQIFLAACELQPGPAASLLDQACAGDAELRREIESLLEHHRSGTIAGQAPGDTVS